MDEVETGQTAAPAQHERAGDVLRAAREAQGLTIAEIGARTRIPLRHLEAIEASDYAGLPSPTYAVGFVKAYARAIGADEVALAAKVRVEAAGVGRRMAEYTPYVIADPSRVPSRGVTIVALGIALALLILVGLWFGTDLFRGGFAGAPAPTAAAPVAAVAPVATPTPVQTGGQVTLQANDDVWMRVYDADNKTLYLGTMKPGDKFDVPPTAKDPMINVGRPDKLAVTLNGAAVPALGTGERAIKDVKVSAEAMAARIAGTPAPTPTATTSSSSPQGSGERRSSERAKPKRKPLTETQRANLQSAAKLKSSAGASSAP